MSSVWPSGRFIVFLAAVFAGLGGADAQNRPVLDPSPTDRPVVQVRLDEARVLRLDAPAQVVIVGNPSIAEATVHDNTTLIVTGRGFGTTNIIALGRGGATIFERQVQVAQARSAVVTVQRSVDLETYICSPECRPTLTVGDSMRLFTPTLQQTQQRNGLATGASGGQAR